MALRINTIEYPFTQRITSLAAATRHDFAAETIYIPETSSRTFRSVHVEVTCDQNNTSATSLTSVLIGIKLGAVAFTDVTTTQTFANSGEINGFGPFKEDVTAYFTSNFGSGASETCQVGVQFGAISVINITAKLVVTYEYDDADDTRVKTVRIPIESITGNLTTSHVEIGTDQIPALTSGGLLPETSVVIRQIWFEAEMSDNSAGTTDWQHGFRLDAGGSDDLDGTHEAFAGASRYYRRIWRPTISDTTVAHKIYSRTTNATSGKCAHQAVMMYVTYEYVESTSSTFLNSVLLGFGGRYGPNAASGDKERFPVGVLINEPATVTLKQSGVYFTYLDNAGSTLSVAVGGQTAVGYTHAAATTDQSGFFMCHRFDSGSAAGSGHTLARGFNNIIVDVYSNTNGMRCADGFVVLNYTSAKASGGSQTHNKTTRWLWKGMSTAAAASTASVLNLPNIPESNYYLSNWAFVYDLCMAAASIAREAFMLTVEQQSGEQDGAGWNFVYSSPYNFDSEMGSGGIRFIGRVMPEWVLKYPGDPTDGMDVEASRQLTGLSGVSAVHLIEQVITYSGITFAKSGTVSNYADADGAGLVIRYFRSSNNQHVGTATTTSGGAHSFTWYDDVDPLFAVLLEDSSHCGASWTG